MEALRVYSYMFSINIMWDIHDSFKPSKNVFDFDVVFIPFK